MAETINVYGLDPGLRHGVLVYAKFKWLMEGGEETILYPMEVKRVFSWTKRDDISIGVGSSFAEISRLADRIATALTKYDFPPYPLALEWDPKYTFFRAGKMQISMTNFFMGYLASTLAHRGYPVVILSPEKSRKYFGLPSSSKKSEVWRQAAFQLGLEGSAERIMKFFPNTHKDILEDTLDAFTLAFVLANTTNQIGGNGR